MLRMRNHIYSAVQDVLQGSDQPDLLNYYGINEEGPVPGLQTNNIVVCL